MIDPYKPVLDPFSSVHTRDQVDWEWPHLSPLSTDADIEEMAWQSALDFLNNRPSTLNEALMGCHYDDSDKMDEADRHLLQMVAECNAEAVLEELTARLNGYVVGVYLELLEERRGEMRSDMV